MPRTSSKALVLRTLRRYVRHRIRLAIQRSITRPNDPDHLEDAIDNLMKRKLFLMESTRYLFRNTSYRCRETVEFDHEDAIIDNSTSFNDEEFLSAFRVNREQARNLVLLLQETSHFKDIGKRERPLLFQLLVFLDRVGQEGKSGSDSKVNHFVKIGKELHLLCYFNKMKLNEFEHILDSDGLVLPVCGNRCHKNRTKLKKESSYKKQR